MMLTKNNWDRIKKCTRLRKLLCFIDRFIPKKKNRIVFCSWPDFSDNSKALYDYLQKEHSDDYELIFIWRYESPALSLKEKMGKIFWHWSIKGILAVWTSKYLCMTHDDFFFYTPSKHILLELFHGMPIKTVGYAEKNITSIRLENYSRIGRYAHFFVTSDVFAVSFSYCFRAAPNQIHVTGQARTDCILNPCKNARDYASRSFGKFSKIMLYAPTYKEKKIGNSREIKKAFNNIFYLDDFNQEDFFNYLKEKNILILMKPHPQDEFFYRAYLKNTRMPENLKIIFDSDLKREDFYFYELFNFCDLMISDYSSITVDFLITAKPVIYLTSVVDEYIETRGMVLSDNYRHLLIGDKAGTYAELKGAIDRNIYENRKSKADRLKELSLLHKYFDGNSCSRIYDILKSL